MLTFFNKRITKKLNIYTVLEKKDSLMPEIYVFIIKNCAPLLQYYIKVVYDVIAARQ